MPCKRLQPIASVLPLCNTRPLMPAPGGAERAVGNNPIAIAVPTADAIVIVLDMATSEAAMGKIRMAAKSGEAIAKTWAVTADGEPTTDPAEAIAGMLLPTGGAKGFGLALLIDLMCGLLAGGAVGAQVRPLYGDLAQAYDCAHLFIAIDVAHFCDPQWFRREAAAAAARIRSGRRAPGVDQLFTPGEPEWLRRRRADDRVTLEPSVIAMLERFAREGSASATRCSKSRPRKTIMPKVQISSPKLRQPNGVFSHATTIEATGRLVFISGMTARRPDGSIAGIGDVTEQTKQVCENVKAAVEAAGGTLDDVCRVDVYVRNMEHFEAIHKVRAIFQAAAAGFDHGRGHQIRRPIISSRSTPLPCCRSVRRIA